MALDLSKIKGYLFDLDGTVYIEKDPIPGAIEALNRLRGRGLPLRMTTNTTTKSRATLYRKLVEMGLPLREDEIYPVIRAAQDCLRKLGSPRLHLLLTDDPAQDFAEFPQDDVNPEIILIGDVGKYWDYKLVQQIFNMVMNGAEMVALHKGRYWQTEIGLQVDTGCFIAGLEFVTSKTATVIGKPSKSFFQLVLDDIGLQPHEVVMVGDDIINDVKGAQDAGIAGILVRTGKYREDMVARSGVTPDLVIDSVADLT